MFQWIKMNIIYTQIYKVMWCVHTTYISMCVSVHLNNKTYHLNADLFCEYYIAYGQAAQLSLCTCARMYGCVRVRSHQLWTRTAENRKYCIWLCHDSRRNQLMGWLECVAILVHIMFNWSEEKKNCLCAIDSGGQSVMEPIHDAWSAFTHSHKRTYSDVHCASLSLPTNVEHVFV